MAGTQQLRRQFHFARTNKLWAKVQTPFNSKNVKRKYKQIEKRSDVGLCNTKALIY